MNSGLLYRSRLQGSGLKLNAVHFYLDMQNWKQIMHIHVFDWNPNGLQTQHVHIKLINQQDIQSVS